MISAALSTPANPLDTFWVMPLVLIGGLLLTVAALALLAWLDDLLNRRRHAARGHASDRSDIPQPR